MEQRDWGRIQQIYNSALLIPRAERSAFVARECHGDPVLVSEVNSLLEADESSGGFLESSVYEMGLQVISSFDNADKLVGTIVDGRYRVERILAEGGMGKVYLAADLTLHDQLVALKVLSDALLQDPDALRRFKSEVHALTLVNHPKVVRVLDAGKLSNGKPYVVMEYIEGLPLRSFIPSRGMDRKWAAWILKEIGAALGHVHSKGILHRDLKPENIMIQVHDDGTESVKIVDFGIARVRDSVGTGTVHNIPIGTLAYMSPEQRRGEELTPASDIYALSVIAYEIVNGERPSISTSTPLRSGRLSGKAKSIILHGLSEKPADRPQSAKQFGEDLANAISKGWDLAAWSKLIAAVLLVALLSFSVYWYSTRRPVALAPSKGFDYWLMVQRMRDGKEYEQPYKSNGADDTFESGDNFQLNVESLESGYLYIFYESPPGPDNVSFRMMHPKKAINDGSATVGGNQTVQCEWNTFRGPAGAENFWIVWSVSPVSELEAAKSEALTHPGAGLTDQNLMAVKGFLTAQPKADVRRYKERREATVRAKSDLVVTLVQFEHR